MESTLAVIDIDVCCGHDELVRERLLENLRAFDDQCVRVLWVNWLRERADLRVVCLVGDLARLDDFLLDVIRSVPGVRGTSAQLAFDGVTHPDALMDISLLDSVWDRRAAATVMLKLRPGQEREAFRDLLALPKHEQVEVVWALKLFHSGDADAMLLLLGNRTAALTGYVMSWIRTIPGILDSQLSSVLDWKILGSTEDFIAVTQRFPAPPEPAHLAGQPVNGPRRS